MFDVAAEQKQLVETWRSAFRTRWIVRPRACVTSLSSGFTEKTGDRFRQVHNIFGWMAGNTLLNRGLCSGAIYRSEKFMEIELETRNGSCGPRKSLIHLQNIHIEHTVPIAALVKRWGMHRASSVPDLAEVYAWTIAHSVATAVHMNEKGGMRQYESRTNAFDPLSAEFCLPFMRYTHMQEPPVVWNVLNGRRIDPERWTFADHFATVDELMKKADGDVVMCGTIRNRARAMLSSLADERRGKPSGTAEEAAA